MDVMSQPHHEGCRGASAAPLRWAASIALALVLAACGPLSATDLMGDITGQVEPGPPVYVLVHPDHFDGHRLLEEAIGPVAVRAAQAFNPLRVSVITGGSSGATKPVSLPSGGLLMPESKQGRTQAAEAEEYSQHLLSAIAEAVREIEPSQTGAAVSQSVLDVIEAAASEPLEAKAGAVEVVVITAGIERTAELDLVSLDPSEATEAGRRAASELPELTQATREVRVGLFGVGDFSDLPEPPIEDLVATVNAFWRSWCDEIMRAETTVVDCSVTRAFPPPVR